MHDFVSQPTGTNAKVSNICILVESCNCNTIALKETEFIL